MQTQFTEAIDGCDVTVTLFDYDEAADLAFELASKLAPVVGALASDTELDLETVAVPMLASAAQSIDAKAWAALLRRLLANVSVVGPFGDDGKKVNLSLVKPTDRTLAFRGRIVLSYKIAWLVMKVNFRDFFDALGPIGQTLARRKP